jgi:hypothetical protein
MAASQTAEATRANKPAKVQQQTRQMKNILSSICCCFAAIVLAINHQRCMFIRLNAPCMGRKGGGE